MLGGILGSEQDLSNSFQRLTAKVEDLHAKIHDIEDPPSEYVLKTTCAGVCKATYLLRLQGDRIPEDLLSGYGSVLRESLDNTLMSRIDDEGWEQAQ